MRLIIMASVIIGAAVGLEMILARRGRRREPTREQIRRRNTTPGGWDTEIGGWL